MHMLFFAIIIVRKIPCNSVIYCFHGLGGKFQDKYYQGGGTISFLCPHVRKADRGLNHPEHLDSPVHSDAASFLGHQSKTSSS